MKDNSGFKKYLKSIDINSDDKNYCLNFCKKLDYLESIKASVIEETHEEVISGFGNVNSKICFIFKDKETYETIKPLIQNIIQDFNVSFWNIYVTFVNKTKCNYAKKYMFLANEIYAINPNVIYFFDKDDTMYNSLLKAFGIIGKTFDKYFNIPVQMLIEDTPESKAQLWKYLHFIVNYKEIE